MVNTVTSSINRKYFVFLLRNNKRYVFLYAFALFIAFPIFVLSLSPTTTNIETLYYIGKVLNLLISISGTVIIPLMLFQFTTSRRSVDVFHALPIRKEYLFMTNYFAGIFILLIPYLLSTFLGVGISLILGMDNISILMETGNFFLVALTMLVSYSITMFAKKNCGTVIDAFLYTIALHLIPVLSYVTYYTFSHQTLLGFNEPFSTNLFYYLTPFPAMFMNALQTTDNFTMNVPTSAYIFYAVFVVGIYVVCSYLFMNHKSENTNVPFVNKYFYPIVSFIATVIAVILIHTFMNAVFQYDGISTYIFPILVGAIFYLVLDVIANRGFKQFSKTVMRFGIISVVVLSFIVPVRLTKGFGYVQRVPDVEDIKSVTVRVNYPLSSYMGLPDYGNSSFTLTDTDEIEVIQNLHQYVLDQYKTIGYEQNQFYRKLLGSNDMSTTLTFEYNLGLTTMSREYQVNLSWLEPLTDLALSPAVMEARFPMVYKPANYKFDTIWLSDTFETNKTPIYHEIGSTSWKIEDLMTAIQKDLSTESKASLNQLNNKTIGFIGIETGSNYQWGPRFIAKVPVKETYTNTISFMRDNNLVMPEYTLAEIRNSKMVLVYPEVNESRMAFYWNTDSEYSAKIDMYGFSYKEVTFEEFSELMPLVHHAFKTEEPNLLLYVQYPDSTIKAYQIRNKDMDLVNTIVSGVTLYQPNGIYEVMYDIEIREGY